MDRLQEGDYYNQPFPMMVISRIDGDALLTVRRYSLLAQLGARSGCVFTVLAVSKIGDMVRKVTVLGWR